jgi:hypothetical protein
MLLGNTPFPWVASVRYPGVYIHGNVRFLSTLHTPNNVSTLPSIILCPTPGPWNRLLNYL